MRALLLLTLLLPLPVLAEASGIPAVTLETGPDGAAEYTLSIQLLGLMTVLTLLPAMLLGMTAFTRIIIVLAILRQALGTGQAPSNQVLLSIALFLTLFIMFPVFQTIHAEAVTPYLAGEMTFNDAVVTGFDPIREFMLAQTRETDIAMFSGIAGLQSIESPEDVPFFVLMASFLTSELKTAFQIGFLLFVPFVVIDLVVASILMSLGMMMLSPMLVSLPFKIMLFVLVDGWVLLMGSLAASFVT